MNFDNRFGQFTPSFSGWLNFADGCSGSTVLEFFRSHTMRVWVEIKLDSVEFFVDPTDPETLLNSLDFGGIVDFFDGGAQFSSGDKSGGRQPSADDSETHGLRERTFMIKALYVELWFAAETLHLKHAWLTHLRLAMQSHNSFKQLQQRREQQWEIKREEIIFTSKDVGRGAFGVVYKGTVWGTPVAIKVLAGYNMDNPSARESALSDLKKEVSILSQLRHPNTVLYIGACTQSPDVCIVTEWCARGTLEELLNNHDYHGFTIQTILRFSLEIAQGMSYLHNLSPTIIHRDLKTQNILVDQDLHAKVCDFGFSRAAPKTDLMGGFYGSAKSMAPEILDNKDYDEKVDVYSYGVVLCQLLSRMPPWPDCKTNDEVKRRVVEGKNQLEIPTWVWLHILA
jgi:hypothetical protein